MLDQYQMSTVFDYAVTTALARMFHDLRWAVALRGKCFKYGARRVRERKREISDSDCTAVCL